MERNETRQVIALLTEYLAANPSSPELAKALEILLRDYVGGGR